MTIIQFNSYHQKVEVKRNLELMNLEHKKIREYVNFDVCSFEQLDEFQDGCFLFIVKLRIESCFWLEFISIDHLNILEEVERDLEMRALNRLVNGKVDNFYPALTGSKTPTSKFSENKEVR